MLRKVCRSFLGSAAALLMFCGCNSDTIYEVTTPKDGEVSNFLPHHELLAKQPAKFPFQYFYMRKKPHRYDNIYIAPVDTTYLRKSVHWEKFDQDMAKKLGSDIQGLANFMHDTYEKEIRDYPKADKPKVVNSPRLGNTAVMRTAIVAIVPTKAELNAVGIAANLLLPGISCIVQQLAAGSIAIECKVLDAQTNEILAMYSAVFQDQAAVINLKALSWYGSAQRNIEKAAKDTAIIFATRDYNSIQRDYPIKLIAY